MPMANGLCDRRLGGRVRSSIGFDLGSGSGLSGVSMIGLGERCCRLRSFARCAAAMSCIGQGTFFGRFFDIFPGFLFLFCLASSARILARPLFPGHTNRIESNYDVKRICTSGVTNQRIKRSNVRMHNTRHVLAGRIQLKIADKAPEGKMCDKHTKASTFLSSAQDQKHKNSRARARSRSTLC